MRFLVGSDLVCFEPEVVLVAGFTGRDTAGIEKHFAELAAQGIEPPDTFPTFYVLPSTALVQTCVVETVHTRTSGEAEIAILVNGEDTYVTIASDHTDRLAEAVDIGLSKQVCPKVIAQHAWRAAEFSDVWDDLTVKSWITEDGACTLYQEGRAGFLLEPQDVLARAGFKNLPRSFALLIGTFPTLGGIRPAQRFAAELSHPSLDDRLRLDYAICPHTLVRESEARQLASA